MGERREDRTKTHTQRVGPRGGTTTFSPNGRVRKNFWIDHDENERLRERAFRDRRSETDIVREGLRLVLELPPRRDPSELERSTE